MGKTLQNDVNYMEGKYAAPRMIRQIEFSDYKTVENAIAVKQELLKNFETEFGYNVKEYNNDAAYSYNYGLLDGLKESLTIT